MDYNWKVSKSPFWICIAMALIGTGCGLDLSTSETGTATLFLITSTLPPTTPPPPSETPMPATAPPTAIPIEGTTITQLNVRGEPSTASPTLGILPAFAKVQILGKDAGGNWYQILYAAGPQGKGWVTARYVQPPQGAEIPPLGGASSAGSGPSGVALQQINIRSGPGTDYDGIGTLNAGDVVGLAGKDADGAWLQVLFPAGPEGRGWVNAAFMRADGVEGLPIVTEAGAVVGTGTPAPAAPAPTSTRVPAFQDGDSAQQPGANVTLSAGGTRALIYTSDLSAPQGDAQDWIGFQSAGSAVSFSLTCEGNGTLGVEVLQSGGAPVPSGPSCGARDLIVTLAGGQPYLVHLQAAPAEGELQYIRYSLTIEAWP
jgi:uncharacterized protein YraI